MIKQMLSGKRLGLMGCAIFLLVNTSALFAQASMESLVEQGNEAYNQGDYRKAIAFYEQTLSMGQHSAALYFNLGNAYYKLNNVAESVYYFEKAQQLNPKEKYSCKQCLCKKHDYRFNRGASPVTDRTI